MQMLKKLEGNIIEKSEKGIVLERRRLVANHAGKYTVGKGKF